MFTYNMSGSRSILVLHTAFVHVVMPHCRLGHVKAANENLSLQDAAKLVLWGVRQCMTLGEHQYNHLAEQCLGAALIAAVKGVLPEEQCCTSKELMGFADPRWGELPWHLRHLLCLAQQSSSWQLPLVLHTTTPNEGCRLQPDPVLYCA